MINSTTLVGRLTRDPELRYTESGVAVANFTLAVNRTYTNQQGEREADFIACQVWRKPAENVANFLKKGSLTGVVGRIQTRNYEGQDGKRVYVTEVIADSVQFLEPRGGNSSNQSTDGGGSASNNSPAGPFNGGNGNGQGNGYQNSQNANKGQNNANNGYSKMNDDPFAHDGKPIDISDDDLPF